ncbi:hypothetical protein GEMRC1_011877 [Eukaryota sp. GEM-RC1]
MSQPAKSHFRSSVINHLPRLLNSQESASVFDRYGNAISASSLLKPQKTSLDLISTRILKTLTCPIFTDDLISQSKWNYHKSIVCDVSRVIADVIAETSDLLMSTENYFIEKSEFADLFEFIEFAIGLAKGSAFEFFRILPQNVVHNHFLKSDIERVRTLQLDLSNLGEKVVTLSDSVSSTFEIKANLDVMIEEFFNQVLEMFNSSDVKLKEFCFDSDLFVHFPSHPLFSVINSIISDGNGIVDVINKGRLTSIELSPSALQKILIDRSSSALSYLSSKFHDIDQLFSKFFKYDQNLDCEVVSNPHSPLELSTRSVLFKFFSELSISPDTPDSTLYNSYQSILSDCHAVITFLLSDSELCSNHLKMATILKDQITELQSIDDQIVKKFEILSKSKIATIFPEFSTISKGFNLIALYPKILKFLSKFLDSVSLTHMQNPDCLQYYNLLQMLEIFIGSVSQDFSEWSPEVSRSLNMSSIGSISDAGLMISSLLGKITSSRSKLEDRLRQFETAEKATHRFSSLASTTFSLFSQISISLQNLNFSPCSDHCVINDSNSTYCNCISSLPDNFFVSSRRSVVEVQEMVDSLDDARRELYSCKNRLPSQLSLLADKLHDFVSRFIELVSMKLARVHEILPLYKTKLSNFQQNQKFVVDLIDELSTWADGVIKSCRNISNFCSNIEEFPQFVFEKLVGYYNSLVTLDSNPELGVESKILKILQFAETGVLSCHNPFATLSVSAVLSKIRQTRTETYSTINHIIQSIQEGLMITSFSNESIDEIIQSLPANSLLAVFIRSITSEARVRLHKRQVIDHSDHVSDCFSAADSLSVLSTKTSQHIFKQFKHFNSTEDLLKKDVAVSKDLERRVMMSFRYIYECYDDIMEVISQILNNSTDSRSLLFDLNQSISKYVSICKQFDNIGVARPYLCSLNEFFSLMSSSLSSLLEFFHRLSLTPSSSSIEMSGEEGLANLIFILGGVDDVDSLLNSLDREHLAELFFVSASNASFVSEVGIISDRITSICQSNPSQPQKSTFIHSFATQLNSFSESITRSILTDVTSDSSLIIPSVENLLSDDLLHNQFVPIKHVAELFRVEMAGRLHQFLISIYDGLQIPSECLASFHKKLLSLEQESLVDVQNQEGIILEQLQVHQYSSQLYSWCSKTITSLMTVFSLNSADRSSTVRECLLKVNEARSGVDFIKSKTKSIKSLFANDISQLISDDYLLIVSTIEQLNIDNHREAGASVVLTGVPDLLLKSRDFLTTLKESSTQLFTSHHLFSSDLNVFSDLFNRFSSLYSMCLEVLRVLPLRPNSSIEHSVKEIHDLLENSMRLIISKLVKMYNSLSTIDTCFKIEHVLKHALSLSNLSRTKMLNEFKNYTNDLENQLVFGNSVDFDWIYNHGENLASIRNVIDSWQIDLFDGCSSKFQSVINTILEGFSNNYIYFDDLNWLDDVEASFFSFCSSTVTSRFEHYHNLGIVQFLIQFQDTVRITQANQILVLVFNQNLTNISKKLTKFVDDSSNQSESSAGLSISDLSLNYAANTNSFSELFDYSDPRSAIMTTIRSSLNQIDIMLSLDIDRQLNLQPESSINLDTFDDVLLCWNQFSDVLIKLNYDLFENRLNIFKGDEWDLNFSDFHNYLNLLSNICSKVDSISRSKIDSITDSVLTTLKESLRQVMTLSRKVNSDWENTSEILDDSKLAFSELSDHVVGVLAKFFDDESDVEEDFNQQLDQILNAFDGILSDSVMIPSF